MDSIVLDPLQLISEKVLEARGSVYFVKEETDRKIFLKLYSWGLNTGLTPTLVALLLQKCLIKMGSI